MKTLIVAVNSKYIHVALAPWYLKVSCGKECGQVLVAEYTINDSMDSVLRRIFNERPDILAFSCYIWNIEYILRLAEDLKKVLPDLIIILGGPEVSFSGDVVLKENTFIDYIISGEGESSFPLLIKQIISCSEDSRDFQGIICRRNMHNAAGMGYSIIKDLDSLQSPYTDEMISSIGNRIVYYESSRGCPFSCSYCLSSTTDGVRYFSMERVRQELDKLVKAGVKQIKFVDRTFNSNRVRAREILGFIIENYAETNIYKELNFHFEAAADLFDDELLQILSRAPGGLIQLEIGVQTTNENALELINRKTDINKVFNNSMRLKEMGNINLHLDLIAGLPEEDHASFIKSFNEVYSLQPQQLQLGFLKMLKGSQIRNEWDKYGYKFRNYAPYEVLENNFISYEEIVELKGIEELVEKYYNSMRFVKSLEFIHNSCFKSAYDFYKSFSEYGRELRTWDRGISSRELYRVLIEFIKGLCSEEQLEIINELLKYDFLRSDNTNNLPQTIHRHVEPDFREKCFAFLKNEDNILEYIPGFHNIPAKQIYKSVHFEKFKYNIIKNLEEISFNRKETVVLFDYTTRDKVTGLYSSIAVNIV